MSDTMIGGEDVLAAGAARWPEVVVTPSQWQTWTAAYALDDGRPRSVELFLTIASGHGVSAAIARLERDHLTPMVESLRRRGALPAVDHADAVQRLAAKLWVGTASRPPAILDYQGAGPLRIWLHVVLKRALISAQRQLARAPVSTSDDAVIAALANGPAPDARLVAADSQAHVKAAYVHALGTLEPRQRLLLRMHICERLSIDHLAVTYQVNRVTVARWLDRARRQVGAEVRAWLTTRLALVDADLDSLLRAAREDFELSVGRLL